MSIPTSGRWYVIVDMTGLRGRTTATVNVLRGPLPPAGHATVRSPLAPIRQAADEYTPRSEGDQAPDAA